MTEKEFAEIVNNTKSTVLSAVRHHLADRFYYSIDDVVQETYLRAYRGLVKNNFNGDSSLGTWLYTIAKNEAIRMTKKLAREEEKASKSYKKTLEEEEFSPQTHDYEIETLMDLIKHLPEKYRLVLELMSTGFSEAQIAEKLTISRGTVKSRAFRGRELIHRRWNNEVIK